MKSQFITIDLLMIFVFLTQLAFAQLKKVYDDPGTNPGNMQIEYYTPKTKDVLFPRYRRSIAYADNLVYQHIILQRLSTPEEICFENLMRKTLYGQQIDEFILENSRVRSSDTWNSITEVNNYRHLLADSNEHACNYMIAKVKKDDFVNNFFNPKSRTGQDKFIIGQYLVYIHVPFNKKYNDQSEYQKYRSFTAKNNSILNDQILKFPPDYLYDNNVFDPTLMIFLFELWYDFKLYQKNYEMHGYVP